MREHYDTTTPYHTKESDPEAYPSDMTGAPWFQGFNVSAEWSVTGATIGPLLVPVKWEEGRLK